MIFFSSGKTGCYLSGYLKLSLLSFISRDVLKFIKSLGIFFSYLFSGEALSMIFKKEFFVLQGWGLTLWVKDISLYLSRSLFFGSTLWVYQLMLCVFCTISSTSLFSISKGIGSSKFNFLIYLAFCSPFFWLDSFRRIYGDFLPSPFSSMMSIIFITSLMDL